MVPQAAVAAGGRGNGRESERRPSVGKVTLSWDVLESRMKGWAAEIERLRAKVDKEMAEVRKEYFERLEDLRDEIEAQMKKWGREVERVGAGVTSEAQGRARELRDRVVGELAEIGGEIGTLKKKARQAEAEAKRVIAQAKRQQKAIRGRLREVKAAGGAAIEDVRAGAGRAWEEMKPALRSAIDRFR
jgi:hypothetical protein